MSKVHTLRAFINQRLTAAAEEILTLFERTISEYEEEIKLQHRLLQHIQDNKAVFSANVKKITDRRQQEWSPSSDPDPPHIKEEQQEVWSSQEAEQLPGLEEEDITKFTSTHFSVKSEDDEEKPQSSQLRQRLSEENRETDPSASSSTEHMQTVRNPDPDRHLQPASDKTSNFSETDDSNVWWKQLKEPQSGLNALKNSEVPVSDVGCNAAKKSFSCSECGKRFSSKDHLQIHMTCHTGEKTFTCPFCGKKFTKRSNLTTHLRVHTGEKPFTCSICNTSFSLRCTLVNHMRVHTGEKPFSCSVCSKRFSKKANLKTHMALHTEEKPFQCRVCDKRFTWHSQVKNHKCV